MSRYDLRLRRSFSESRVYQGAEAFTRLYERTHLVVFRYIYALYGEPREDVEDLWLETYLKAWRSRDRFEGNESAALGWLLHIARNLVIDKHRTNQRHLASELTDTELVSSAADNAPESQMIAAEQSQSLWKSLSRLPQQQQDILVLRYVLGWRVKAIADHLQVPENTISVTLRRALAKLADLQESL
ncbi:MAG: sigma-70 family RNA polymerase sigma factor [bacterium]|nr:sigma-70 family RNA polymerase sigma factor [bacterium]